MSNVRVHAFVLRTALLVALYLVAGACHSQAASPPTPTASGNTLTVIATTPAAATPTIAPASATVRPAAPERNTGVLVVVGSMGVLFAVAALVLLGRGIARSATESCEFHRHWGGFGGSRTGWRFSRPLAEIGAGLVLALLAALLGVRLLG